MKKIVAILFVLLFLAGCKGEDTVLSERDKIVKYLTSRNICSEDEIGDQISSEPPFYTSSGSYSYRYIVNYYDAGREERPVIEWGDTFDIQFFNAYVFTGSEPSINSIYWSNIPEIMVKIANKGGNTLNWSTEPLTVKLGSTKIVGGLESAFQGCYEGDSIQVFMTSNLGYGGKRDFGIVPKNSMLAWYIRIGKVSKVVE
jgi:hypothetical protein